MLDEYTRLYRTMTSDGNLNRRIEDIAAKGELARKKKSKLLELVSLDSITPADFKSMTADCNRETEDCERELQELRTQQESSEEFRIHMEKVRKVLQEAERDANSGEITKEFIDTFIDEIFVTPETDGSMRLDIRIFTGDTIKKTRKNSDAVRVTHSRR